ncbi:MAG: pentapeptide repeat-containing protein [Paracoccaceae bacterium]
MANPQHIEWLLEGVEAWNARRQHYSFVPDFTGLNFNDALKRTHAKLTLVPQGGKVVRVETPMFDFKDIDFQGVDLRGARLHDAMFNNANLNYASLDRTNFLGSTFRQSTLTHAVLDHTEFANCHFLSASLGSCEAEECSFTNARISGSYFGGSNFAKASFSGARIRGTDFSGSNFDQADFTDADVRSDLAEGRLDKILSVDFMRSQNLTQTQLGSMLGDSATIIPDHLSRPAHWSEFEMLGLAAGDDPAPEPAEPHQTTPNQIALRDQVAVLLTTKIRSADAAGLFSDQLDAAIAMYRAANPSNQPPDDLLLTEELARKIREIRTALQAENSPKLEQDLADLRATINALRETIAAQATEIKTLQNGKVEKTNFQTAQSAFAEKFGATLGTGAATVVLTGSGYLLGQYGAPVVDALKDTFITLFNSAPPPPPSLPPGISV